MCLLYNHTYPPLSFQSIYRNGMNLDKCPIPDMSNLQSPNCMEARKDATEGLSIQVLHQDQPSPTSGSVIELQSP